MLRTIWVMFVLAWCWICPTVSIAAGPAGFNPEAQPVRVAVARVQDVPVFLAGLGTVTPFYTVLVQSRVDGQLMEVCFDDGQDVKKGDLLANIDPRPFEAQLAQAQGNLMRDTAFLENARRDAARYAQLMKEKATSPLQAFGAASLVGQYEGIVKTDKGLVDAAKLQLEYCRITAPISGRLGFSLVDPGNMIQASGSTGLVLITQVEPIDVIFALSETVLPDVFLALARDKNPPVEAWDREQTKRLAAGKFSAFDNQIDPSTGTLRIKAEFPNKDGVLFPSQFVNARMHVDTLKKALTIPASAIQLGSRGSFVYVVGPDNKVSVRVVNVIYRTNTLAVIGPGPPAGADVGRSHAVADGDKVVIDGLDRLREGVPVMFGEAVKTPDADDVGKR